MKQKPTEDVHLWSPLKKLYNLNNLTFLQPFYCISINSAVSLSACTNLI